MRKKLVVLFVFISLILLLIYSYGLNSEDSSKDAFNEVDKEMVVPEDEGVEAVEGSQINERIDESILVEEIKEKITLILDKLKDIKTDQLVLANKWNLLGEDYEPSSLVNIVEDVPSTKDELKLQEDAYKGIVELFESANKDGLTGLRAVSGYRPYSYQSQLFNAKVNYYAKEYDLETAKEKASEIVAIPGTSEHQTGLALDFSNLDLLRTADPLVEEFKNTPEGKWLYNNSWKYGFVLRYVPEKKDITGIISEPWHFRYVGIPHAEYMTSNNLSFEEYIDIIKKENQIIFEDYYGNKYQINYVQNENRDILLSDSFNMDSVVNVSEVGEEEYIITQKIDE